MNLFDAIFKPTVLSKTAILYEQEPLTYAEIHSRSLAFTGILESFNIHQGDRVALLLNDSPEFVVSFIAICSTGAIAVPINMGLKLEEQLAILRDCTPKMAVVEAELCNSLTTDGPQSLEHILAVRHNHVDQTPPSSIPIYFLEHLFAAQPQPTSFDFPEPGPDTPAFILYTSGSTGEPKGAVHCQSDIFYTNETFCAEVLQLRAGDRLFSSSRLPFAYGLGNSFSFPLLNGATSILCSEKPTPEVIARVFTAAQPTIFFGVPVVYNLLLDYHRRGNHLDCSSLRLCVSAGEALPAQLGEDWERTFGIELLDGIGSTEMLHMFMSNHRGDVRYGSSGKLLRGYDAELRNESGAIVEVEGNLWIRGNSAAIGYWQKPDVSERTFVDGWVRTGDLYRRDDDGYWFHMGRSDDCFKSSGQWVSPVEVEGVLLRHSDVQRAAVVEFFDGDGLPCACAFVISEKVESETSSLEQELRKLAKESLPRFKQPRKYVFVEEFPYTATGKVQRFKLRQSLRSQVSGLKSQVSSLKSHY